MKIEESIKLDFSDVLIKPNRSTLSSRADVDLIRDFTFANGRKWSGVPIAVANMDTTGTFEMYKSLMPHRILTCLHKFYSANDYILLINELGNSFNPDYLAVTIGTRSEDYNNLTEIMKVFTPTFICIDVANGYSNRFVEFCRKVRELCPESILIGGNVVTGEMVQELIINGGLDIVKIGIGSGCFVGSTKVLMANGTQKNIKDVKVGDQVINMNGKTVRVKDVTNQGVKHVIKIRTSNWKDYTFVTPDHKFWTSNNKWESIEMINGNTTLMGFSSVNNVPVYVREKHEHGMEETFDIEVDCNTHSFIANGCIVHNSVCTTRLQTGVGYPQLSSVIECADVAHGLNAHIMSDGGIQQIGDFGKAFGAGADFVMAGSMFAGHDESTGELVEDGGVKYKVFYGMSSEMAMNKYYGGVANYRTSEGKAVKVKYKGKVNDTLDAILGGIRSTMTYIGARKLKHIPKCTTFLRVNHQVNTFYN